MVSTRLHEAAARVVAWHNRHPLARRITAAQVVSVGFVALPFSQPAAAGGADAGAPATGSLRDRARARARVGGGMAPLVLPAASPPSFEPNFSEDFIAPLAPRRVAGWARRHGRPLAPPPHEGPLRCVLADALPAGREPALLYVLTAAIEAGSVRRRVLLPLDGGPATVLGRRLWSVPRAGALGLLLLALGVVGGGAGHGLRGGGPADALRLAAAMASSASASVARAAAMAPAADADGGPAAEAVTVPEDVPTPANVQQGHAVQGAYPPNQVRQAHQLHQPDGALATRDAQAAHEAHEANEANEAHEAHEVQIPTASTGPTAAGATPAMSRSASAPSAVAPTAPPDAEPRLGRVMLPELALPLRGEAREAARRARLDSAAAARADRSPALAGGHGATPATREPPAGTRSATRDAAAEHAAASGTGDAIASRADKEAGKGAGLGKRPGTSDSTGPDKRAGIANAVADSPAGGSGNGSANTNTNGRSHTNGSNGTRATANAAPADALPTAPAPTVTTAVVAQRPAAPGAAPAFAVSSRALRTRTEAQLVRDAMQALLRGAAAGVPPVQVDVLAQGDDWRVVGWPFGQRGQAERARTVLVSRGMRVEVVDF